MYDLMGGLAEGNEELADYDRRMREKMADLTDIMGEYDSFESFATEGMEDHKADFEGFMTEVEELKETAKNDGDDELLALIERHQHMVEGILAVNMKKHFGDFLYISL